MVVSTVLIPQFSYRIENGRIIVDVADPNYTHLDLINSVRTKFPEGTTMTYQGDNLTLNYIEKMPWGRNPIPHEEAYSLSQSFKTSTSKLLKQFTLGFVESNDPSVFIIEPYLVERRSHSVRTPVLSDSRLVKALLELRTCQTNQ